MHDMKLESILRISIPLGLVCLAFFLGFTRYMDFPNTLNHWVIPKPVHDLKYQIDFTSEKRLVTISTFLPGTNYHQTVLESNSKAPYMQQTLFNSSNGLVSRWQGAGDAKSISVDNKVIVSGVSYDISNEISLDDIAELNWDYYLQETDAIAVNSPEIASLWQQIAPENSSNMLSVLDAIYRHIAEMPTLPFNGTTDSLTALRLGAASCNGKSRLFVALTRHLGIPSRLVGGIVLTDGAKRTSHQWVEVNIQDQWVPFDPTNHHFARLPANYLALYWGDKALFTRTANIPFDYNFEITQSSIAPAIQQNYKPEERDELVYSLANLLTKLNISASTSAILIMLPLCTLIIALLRNVIGISTFGNFMPMLIASACITMGFTVGIVGFLAILILATLCGFVLSKINLLKIPRLAILVSMVNIVGILLLYRFEKFTPVEIGLMSIFPVIIISFIADKLNELIEEKQWSEIAINSLGTVLSISLCYLAMESRLLQGVFAVYSEAYLVVLAGLIFVGQWSGLKLSELFRFKDLLIDKKDVVGINERNTQWVAKHNSSNALKIATDKLQTKQLLHQNRLPTPTNIAVFSRPPTTNEIMNQLGELNDFVIKPNCGSQGKGIVVINRRDGNVFYSIGGKRWTLNDISNHINNIICGRFSNTEFDTAYIEPRIVQHPAITSLAPNGLSDIRIIALEKRILCAMLRLPTAKSQGKANLHQGALGASIDLETGMVKNAKLKRQDVSIHPDSKRDVIGFVIPYWHEVMEIAHTCADTNQLGYIGIDISIDKTKGPLILEVNGRPGLEIQNIQKQTLRELASEKLTLQAI